MLDTFEIDMGHHSFVVPMILFDILQLDAVDAITVRPESYFRGSSENTPSNNTFEHRFNLLLLYRV